MFLPKTCPAALAALCLAGLAHATTWTVDDDGPADFSDVPDALAVAAPGDVVLVAAGTYSPFTLSERVTVIGQDALVPGVIDIANVPAPGRAIVSGFSAAKLLISDCAGRVLLDRLVIGPAAGTTTVERMRVTSSVDVRLHRSTIGAITPVGQLTGIKITASRVEVVDSAVAGTHGPNGGFCQSGGNGSPGIDCMTGADLHLSGTTAHGGRGGNGAPSCLFFPVGGSGAAAVLIRSGASALVTGIAEDLLQGGDGGFGESPELDGFGASGLVVNTGGLARFSGASAVGGDDPGLGGPVPGIGGFGEVDLVAPVDASLDTSGEPLAGGVVTFVVHGPEGASARIRLGRAPRIIDLASTYEDRLLDPLRLISLGGIPASGEVTLPFQIGATWPAGTLIMAQASCTTAEGTTLSQSVPLVVR